MEVKSGTTATISCVITEISSRMNLEWWASSGKIDTGNSDYIQDLGTMTAGKQTATLVAKVPTKDQTFTCRVKSERFPESPESNKRVQINVYGKQ